MNFSDVLLLMAIALILFGPEDLPDIARIAGKFIYELRKATREITKELGNNSNIFSLDQNQINSEEAVQSLTFESEQREDKENAKKATENPLLNLPEGIVSFENK